MKYVGLFLAIIYFVVLIFDIRILVFQKKVAVGESYYVEGWGNIGESTQASIVCNYFNGHQILSEVFWYSPNNFLGKNTCPIFDSRN